MTLHTLAELLANLRIPGGCTTCHAHRTLTAGHWVTHHSDVCPDPWKDHHMRINVVGTPAIEARFWAKVDIRESDDCWEWQQSGRDKDGYGTFWINGGTQRAPRVSWLLAHPELAIPDGQMGRHDCDNPPCVNPSHLRLGTSQENDADRVARSRSATGDQNGSRRYPDRLPRGADNIQYQPNGCRNGHAEDRRYVRQSTGERVCLDCIRDRQRRSRAKARKAAF